jgi:HPt (histidine-containing phosphotransfer) domain-containing protein
VRDHAESLQGSEFELQFESGEFRHCHVMAVAVKAPSEGAAPANVGVWDKVEALERLGGDEALLREVVGIFLEDAPAHLATLRRAIDEGNPETIEKTAHSLKGEMGYLGISDLSLKAGELERMGKERELKHAAQLFAVFEAGMSAVVEAMRSVKNMNAGVQVPENAPDAK